jgi:hypothetical protein
MIKTLIEKVRSRLCKDADAIIEPPKLWVPVGHFYSPYPSIEEIRQNEEKIFDTSQRTLAAIDLNEEEQVQLFWEFAEYYKQIPFTFEKTEKHRFYFDNPSYSHGDAIDLYCMVRHLTPKRIMEIGSGHSSSLTLDINEIYFENSIECTFIEPHPQLLYSLLRPNDLQRVTIHASRLQDVELDLFSRLEENDILFIDSTHVSKVNSDVNRIFFEILPSLNKGVYIHFHDVGYPFEYPPMWIYEGRAWQEAYLLRAFLQYNAHFKIKYFNNFLLCFHKDLFDKAMPTYVPTGGSIWLQKVVDP